MMRTTDLKTYNNSLDEQYDNLVKDILQRGTPKKDRTGTGTISVFGRTLTHKMSEGFPLLTGKTVHTKSVLVELFWFLGLHMQDKKYSRLGSCTNIKYLLDNDCNIWVGDAYKNYENSILRKRQIYTHIASGLEGVTVTDVSEVYPLLSKKEYVEAIKNDEDFAIKHGNLGPIYGKQWTDCDGVNQVENLIRDLKEDPDSRRLLVDAWNVKDLKDMVLPPCHFGFQCYTRELTEDEILRYMQEKYGVDKDDSKLASILEKAPKRELSLRWMQRSVDVGLGLPFNIASYGFLLEMLAQIVNMVPGEISCSLGDTHIYNNHVDGLKEQLTRETYELPELVILGEISKLKDYKLESSFLLRNYKNSGNLKLPLSN